MKKSFGRRSRSKFLIFLLYVNKQSIGAFIDIYKGILNNLRSDRRSKDFFLHPLGDGSVSFKCRSHSFKQYFQLLTFINRILCSINGTYQYFSLVFSFYSCRKNEQKGLFPCPSRSLEAREGCKKPPFSNTGAIQINYIYFSDL